MAYIGQGPGSSGITDRTLDTVTSDGSTTSLVLTGTADAAEDVAVYFDGVMQRPGTDFTLANNTLTFTSPVPNGVFVVAYTGGAEHIGSPLAGSVTSDMIVDNAVIDAKVVTGVDASKITGALGAFDGSALTGIAGTITVTKTSSDPTITDNPSNVGALHLNTTTGEMFVCTDNTTDENVWVNVGEGSVGVISDYGYTAGGNSGSYVNVIDKFLFASTAAATDHGDLPAAGELRTGSSSSLNGFVATGLTPSFTKKIDSFNFVNASNSVRHGDLSFNTYGGTGHSSSTEGYAAGGFDSSNNITTIDRYAFENASPVSGHGNLSHKRRHAAGHQSSTDGFVSGGGDNQANNVPSSDQINKFSFASNTTAAQHGDMNPDRKSCSGNSSSTHGFIVGNDGSDSVSKTLITKFAFASSGSEANHSDLDTGTQTAAGINTTDDGYSSGGTSTSPTTKVQKFSFSSGTTAVEHTDLTVGRTAATGHQK